MHNIIDDGYTLIWSFRNRIELLKRSIKTAHSTCPLDIAFYLVDAASDDKSIKELRSFVSEISDRKIRICESARRTSLSEAWNIGMMLSTTRYVIFASSDVEFISPHWHESMEIGFNKLGYRYILIENHAVFALDKKIIPTVGWFDENFLPGPHFDTDYMIRVVESGLPIGSIPNAGLYIHGHDDAEEEGRRKDKDFENPDRLPMNDLRNEIYFKEKWKSDWGGWQYGGHPPNHPFLCERRIPELDPHPICTKKII